MVFRYILYALGIAALAVFFVIWLIELEEEHNEETAFREHLEDEKRAIDSELDRAKRKASKRKK